MGLSLGTLSPCHCLENKVGNARGELAYTSSTRIPMKKIGDEERPRDTARGQMEYTDGSVYVGPWMGGKRHGKGKIYASDGKVEDGTWENGELRPTEARRRLQDLTGYPKFTISRIIREEERSRRTSNLPLR